MVGVLDARAPEHGGTGAAGAVTITSRTATLAVAFVFVGFVVNAFSYVLSDGRPVLAVAVAAALLVVMLVAVLSVQLGTMTAVGRRIPRRVRTAALVVLVVLVYAPIPVYGIDWFGLQGFVAGGVLLVLRGAPRVAACAAVCVLAGVLFWTSTGDALNTLYLVVITAVTGLTMYGLSRIRSFIRGLESARSQLAALSVARERLRFAQELQGLVDDRLSRIEVASELVLRLVARRPELAVAELDAVSTTSRAALESVRSVADSYRQLSVTRTIASVRTVLGAAGIVVTVAAEPLDLPPETESLLVVVLRRAVDEVLGHGRATRCALSLAREGGSVRLELGHDGTPQPEPQPGDPQPDDWLRGEPAERVRRAGGRLRAGAGSDGDTVLAVELPLPAPGADAAAEPAGRPMELRGARRILVAVLAGISLNGVVFAVLAPLPPAATAVCVACIVGVAGLQLLVFSRTDVVLAPHARYALLAAQAVLVYVPIVAFGQPLVGLPGFLAGSALLLLPRRAAVVAFVLVVASVAVAQATLGGGAFGVSYGVIATLDHGLVVFGLTSLCVLVAGLSAARTGLATAAVVQERLRFARDLHDLLGYSLSAISLKAAVAVRLVGTGQRERAGDEVRELLGVARQARADARSVSSYYRELVLDDEIASVRSVLAAADVDLELDRGTGELPEEVGSVLATVLREGVCNLLRHSAADRCRISIVQEPGAVELTIVNNGAPRRAGPHAGGISNLTSRVDELAGTTTSGPGRDGEFTLDVRIPL